jgi:hypothetical protein
MINDIRFQANWDRIKNNKQNFIESSDKVDNLSRIKHKYNVGDHIILWKPGIWRKLLAPIRKSARRRACALECAWRSFRY